MNCKVCGTLLPDEAIACWKCGTRIGKPGSVIESPSPTQVGRSTQAKRKKKNRVALVTGTIGILILLVLFVIWSHSRPPSDAIVAAQKYARRECWQYSPCEGFKTTDFRRQEVTTADERNGITERWCFIVEAVCKPVGQYQDWVRAIYLAKQNGEWELVHVSIYGCEPDYR
jgi:hypothetical protein